MADNEKILSDKRAVLDRIYEDMAKAEAQLEMLVNDKEQVQASIDACKKTIKDAKTARIKVIADLYQAQSAINATEK